MTETAPRVIIIPANPELAKEKAVKRQQRVAAYCRVSTDEEEQLTSYEAQAMNFSFGTTMRLPILNTGKSDSCINS